MTSIIVIFHVTICVLLVLIVLLQAGKGADMGATFGGGSQTVFGSGGAAPFLTKLTTAIAILFMVTSISLTMISSRQARKTVVESITTPAVPVPQTTTPPISTEHPKK